MGGLVALLRRGAVGGSTAAWRVPVATCTGAKEHVKPLEEPANIGDPIAPATATAPAGNDGAEVSRPLLMVDIDGVISLFGGSAAGLAGSFHSIDGIPHFLSATAAAHLLELSISFDLVWASGWEEKADEHLPHLLGLPAGLPHLSFERSVGRANAHWKLAAIDRHAAGRPLAWLDDALGEECNEWARLRSAPTLLIETDPRIGLTEREAGLLMSWARSLRAG
jgi:hypothetical protein